MQFDWYTKAVLTVIALCLVWMSIGGPSLIVPLSAQVTSGYSRVVIAGWADGTGQEHQMSNGLPVVTQNR
jgi:hypothetical protein